jgi:hypothetical protein
MTDPFPPGLAAGTAAAQQGSLMAFQKLHHKPFSSKAM